MKILIAGDDEAALRLAEGLMAAHEVWLLVPEATAAGPSLDHLDVEVVRGTAISTPTLVRARVQEADVFIACTTRDEENIVACILARQRGAGRTVCFLFRPDVGADEADEVLTALEGTTVDIESATTLEENIRVKEFIIATLLESVKRKPGITVDALSGPIGVEGVNEDGESIRIEIAIDRRIMPGEVPEVVEQEMRDWLTGPERDESGPVMIERALCRMYKLKPPAE